MRIVEKEAEAHLIELLNLVKENRQGWKVLCFNFSHLLEHYRSEYQIKIATNLMNDLLGDLDGAIYLSEDSTIYVMVRFFSDLVLDKMVFQLRYLFMDDPLAYTPEGDENPDFVSVYDIETQWEEFSSICKRRLVTRVRQTRSAPVHVPRAVGAQLRPVEMPDEFLQAAPMIQPLTSRDLAFVERALNEVDIAAAIRRQPICASIPNTAARNVFDEMYVNISSLADLLDLDLDLRSDRALFRYISRLLDVRMLDAIQAMPSRYLINPVSLNLNVETLLSNRFAEFDAAVKPATKVSIVIEIQLADVFSDMAALLTAKDIVQRLGYRLCLDGTTELSFPQINRQSMGFDLVKLIWNADFKEEVGSYVNQRLTDAVKRCGANRVILTRCDSKEAVEFGQAIGITLFQGRYLDSLINPQSQVVN
jgi:EAL domain-containing protein (putative c-di-GMP-specific phosphodiesterase class I)